MQNDTILNKNVSSELDATVLSSNIDGSYSVSEEPKELRPRESSENSNVENQTILNENISVGLNVSIPRNKHGKLLEKQDQIYVSNSNAGTKSYACPICYKLVKKLPRHLESVHKNDPEIEKITVIPKNRIERKHLLSKLRKEGRYQYNYRASLNEQFQVARRPGCKHPKKTVSEFMPCPNCKEILNKVYLRQHFPKCSGRSGKHTHSLQRMSRRMFMNVHE